MEFHLISFRLGNILDFGEANDAKGISNFANERTNADSFHAHPRKKTLPFYLAGSRISKSLITWEKVFYTDNRRQFA